MKPESFPVRQRASCRKRHRPLRTRMSHAAVDRTYKSVWWSLVVAPNWVAEEDEYCVSFTNPHGVGALQISAYKHDSGDVPEDDLRDSNVGQFPEDLTPEPVVCGAFSGIGVDYE